MNTIINVMNSLVKLNGWTVERFDIQRFNAGFGYTGYVGYLTTTDGLELRIREDATFEKVVK